MYGELMTPPFVLPSLSDEVLTAKFFRALGDPTRLRILRLLLERERTVSELVAQLRAPQGRVSSHLACLRWCGYVRVRRQGRYAYYGVGDPRVREILEVADSLVRDHTDRIRSCTLIDHRPRRRRQRRRTSS